MKYIPCSPQAKKFIGKKSKVVFIGKIPICPPGHISEEKRKDFIMNHLRKGESIVMEDVCDKTGLKHYEIFCTECGAKQGDVYAANEKMDKWCSFRYYNELTKKGWVGCFTPNVSPFNGELRLECTCSADTREMDGKFREKEVINSQGRNWGSIDAKFVLKEV